MPSSLVMPDSGALVFSISSVPYGFSTASSTFWGAGTSFMGGPQGGIQGSASIIARVAPTGQIVSGNVLVFGVIPALGITQGSLLVLGDVLSVGVGYGSPHFWASFLFKISFSHPAIPYKSPIGVWDAYFNIPGWSARNISKLFQSPWGPATASLNSYVGQVKCFY